MTADFGKKATRVDRLIDRGAWAAAERLLRVQLRAGADHWFAARLAYVLRRQGEVRGAILVAERSLRQSTSCPLLLWELASSLEEAGQTAKADALFARMARTSERTLAYGECGEGLRYARGLRSDAAFARARIAQSMGNDRRAARLLRLALRLRGPSASSLHSREWLVKQLRRMELHDARVRR